tara:strand:+ start:3999 stop:4865 length:867 start_codon:yes stop_codon:yes gene_type:complete
MTLLYKKGDKGQEVKRLQKTIGGVVADGDFGPKTEGAVRDYQKSSALGVDGVVGPATRRKLGIDIYAGVDVSHWNGNVRWPAVAESEVKFVWVKVTQGRDHVDKTASTNLEGARENGIIVGGYHFPSPQIGQSNSKDPEIEVKNFLQAYGGKIPEGDMTPVLDLEAGVKGDPDHNRQWALEWLRVFEDETGLRPVIYTAKWYVNAYLRRKVGDLKNYKLWVADYTKPYSDGGRNEPDSTCGWDEYSVWQWTSKGKAVGLDQTGIRKCDMNWLVGGPDAFKELQVCKNH